MRRTLGDRYHLGEVIGRGGMATVYRATDTVLDRQVAIKTLAERYAGDRRFVERFRREAQASASLNHPNIVSVFDTGDQDGIHYIVMELVEGRTLADVLAGEGRLSPERSARIAAEVAAALQSAHEQGIVHRDVKPGNVMLTRDGSAKVMDFGIARAAEEDGLTQTGMVLGTAAYLSPEQCQGRPVDARSDVYALGCILREMLTARPPFTGDTPVSIAYKHVNESPTPPSSDVATIRPELDSMVMRALEKDPDRRFPTAASFGAALADAAAGVPTEPIAAGGDTAILPAAPESPERRRRWPMVAAFLAAFAIAALLTTALLGSEPTAERDGGAGRATEEASPSPSPEIADVGSALANLEAVVQEAVAGDTMTPSLGEAVIAEAAKAADEYEKGSLDKALEHLAHADDRVQEGLEQREVTPESAEATAGAIAAVAAAMEAAPPEAGGSDEGGEGEGEGGQDEGGEGEGGPGNSDNAPGPDGEGPPGQDDDDEDD